VIFNSIAGNGLALGEEAEVSELSSIGKIRVFS
jgi:hypothetical protein